MEEQKNNKAQEHKNNKEEKIITLKESEYQGLLDEVKKGKESQDKMLRNQADLENTRKRIDR